MLCMALKPLFAATFPASTGIETLNKKRIVVVLLSRAFYMDGSAIATSFHGKMASGGPPDSADSDLLDRHRNFKQKTHRRGAPQPCILHGRQRDSNFLPR